jgi:Leucine-rich repeat (LRR) protein
LWDSLYIIFINIIYNIIIFINIIYNIIIFINIIILYINYAYEKINEIETNNRIYFVGNNSFASLNKLKGLYFDFNNLTRINSNHFSNLQSLIGLNLSNNNISFIENSSFVGLDQLVYLDLGYNKLKNINSNHFSNI